MPKLKKQRKRKKYQYNISRKRLRNKLSGNGAVLCKELKESWDRRKSVKNNMLSMGLAFDPNATIKIEKTRGKLTDLFQGDDASSETNVPEIPAEDMKLEVLEKLKEDAYAPRRKAFRLPNTQVEWCSYLLNKHGLNYHAMVKDRKNYNQETWKQLRIKIRKFQQIPEQYEPFLEKYGHSADKFVESETNKD
ncbi:PREDICTED: nucleolar protein 16 [Nicrophorus vespilloides]|uniref:Nucleolar protein 16 n=1 Tax=Nicrophorus vespilloides TaxID=110193 RepID=A0ABM1NHH8_NICVS|nr:PREDICTED: nucleolar protein 16 [Nicrophorus vespilloides]